MLAIISDYFLSTSALWTGALSLVFGFLAKAAPAMKSIGETKKAQWLERFIKKRGRMICTVFAIIVFVAGNFYQFYRVSVERDDLSGMLGETQRQLDQAQAALKVKRDRTATVEKLQDFYISGSRLAKGGGLTATSTHEEVKQYIEETNVWANNVEAWIQDNMGAAAADRFRDIEEYYKGAYPYTNTVNADHVWRMNVMTFWRRNLKKLMQTEIWDRPNGTR